MKRKSLLFEFQLRNFLFANQKRAAVASRAAAPAATAEAPLATPIVVPTVEYQSLVRPSKCHAFTILPGMNRS